VAEVVERVEGAHQIVIRPLTPADLPVCDAILHSLPDWFGIEDAIQHYLKKLSDLDGYVAEVDRQVVGLIGLLRHNPQSVEINVLAVRPEHRGKGLGRALVRKVENSLNGQGRVVLHTKTLAPSDPDPFYAETRAFWKAMGFMPLEENLLWGAENPCLMLVKPQW
jgi:ribosomal protein S18 acetylase RimI-like enzyme